MNVAELLESRRTNWRQLEQYCTLMEGRRRRKLGGAGTVRFAALYRAACADLALADAYQLPANTVGYLHQLVARAHNLLYRSRRFDFPRWGYELFQAVPQRLRADRFLRAALLMFWGLFFFSLLFARLSPDYAVALVGKAALHEERNTFSEPLNSNNGALSSMGAGFYVYHNTSIGLECFAWGLLLGVGGLVHVVFNAVQLGAMFGYMSTVPEWNVFFQFVTAHSSFELTAIVLSAAAGMRLGFAMIDTRGLSRAEAVRQAGRQAMPVMGAAIVMFALAGMIEAFLSPSAAPYALKLTVAIVSAALIFFYIVILGRPRTPAADRIAADAT